MDSSNLTTAETDFSKLSANDKQELRQFIANENQKAVIQNCTCFTTYSLLSLLPFLSCMHRNVLIVPGASTAIHVLTDVCWRKCIPGAIRGGKLDKNEENCAQNCVERFMDAKFTFLTHLDKLRQQT
ncbi:putative Mitochondrial import inner membrane translocase subunit tim-8 [Blumeria hordei DH14]|uniref:Mitochondrial import inner membrane translocase subunit n=1 Tax=Blumeria graminis f. sp. hordei (strain DH14) TaxID=546991 RepID=N1JHT8_BLUG1|nr:putative Mitochondrial import inner membrane translocase subunit tim-8 [Blumeria hordei DH14]